MQEFSSVTASSYDAESLAPMLNDKAADGWSVVSIVTAGTNVVAYLCRDVDDNAASDDTAASDETAAPAAPAAAPAPEEPTTEEPTAVEEPAGWAAAPDDGSDTSDHVDESTGGSEAPAEGEASIADLGAGATSPEAAPVEEAPPAAEPPAAEPAVPAGWYADPSGRFELRYWDGTAWTEHVSRNGQQFTDPPVA